MKKIIFNLFADNRLVDNLQKKIFGCARGLVEHRNFPDGETYIRVESPVADKEVIVVCNLAYPDEKILPLLYFVETVKSLGAKSVGLIAPYLPYMRQDTRFQTGEGITSNYFASLLSRYFSWLVTVDPHLHRHHSLNEIYSIPAKSLHATGLVAAWIQQHVAKPLLVGPDKESTQWVAEVAKQIDAPYVVLEKKRQGDRDVEISVPNLAAYYQHTPVLLDDIISTGKTLLVTVEQILYMDIQPPACIAVHGLFVENAYENLLNAGVTQIVTCNTIPHPSNQIDVSSLLAESL